mmetsp:Transcript_19399/g.45111  ORF Transcript_19399/g.45111 Transcript_19399/m.45111 type:complete len:513 (+) Transcript_19399:202-1740(+)
MSHTTTRWRHAYLIPRSIPTRFEPECPGATSSRPGLGHPREGVLLEFPQQLVVRGVRGNDRLQELLFLHPAHHVVVVDHLGDADGRQPAKAVVVDPGAQGHQELAIQPIRDTSVARDEGIEVLDPVGPLDGGRQEPPEGRHNGGEECQPQGVNLDGVHVLEDHFEVVKGLGFLARDAAIQDNREELSSVRHGSDLAGFHRANFDNPRNHLDQALGKEFKELGREDALGLHKQVMGRAVRAFQCCWKQLEIIDRAGHPREFCQEPTQIPRNNQGADSTTDESFPCFVRREPDQGPLNELAAARYSAKVGHDVIAAHQQEGKAEPKQSVEDVVHEVLHLPEGQAQNDDRPAELVQLELDVADLHGGNRQDEDRRIQHKRHHFGVLRVRNHVVQVGVRLDDVADEIPVGVEDGDEKPGPLGRSEQGHRVLDPGEVAVVTHLDELPEEQELPQGHHPADVHVAQIDARRKDADEPNPGDHPHQQLRPTFFVLGNLGSRHRGAGARRLVGDRFGWRT